MSSSDKHRLAQDFALDMLMSLPYPNGIEQHGGEMLKALMCQFDFSQAQAQHIYACALAQLINEYSGHEAQIDTEHCTADLIVLRHNGQRMYIAASGLMTDMQPLLVPVIEESAQ